MQLGISTRVLLQHRLQTAHLDAFARAGATYIELFAARHHFDYTDRPTLRETAAWFRSNDVVPSLHQPIYADAHWTRHTAPNLNLISLSKPQRIEAADEVKRAIEIAETIPIRSIVLHLGLPYDPSSEWSEQTIDHTLTALEHLKAFAAPLGVQLLLENLLTDVATPPHLLEILRIGHFDTVGICYNAAHAHLAENQKDHGILPALDLLKPLIAVLHLSDNDGRTDQHLWPTAAIRRHRLAQHPRPSEHRTRHPRNRPGRKPGCRRRLHAPDRNLRLLPPYRRCEPPEISSGLTPPFRFEEHVRSCWSATLRAS